MSAETPDRRIPALQRWNQANDCRIRLGTNLAAILAAADAAVEPELSRLRRQHAAALALCDEAESAVGSGCLCRWDEDGSPVGEHGPRCFKTFGWDLDPAAVRAALEETP